MASTPKVLGQSAPAATTLTTLYTVPAATSVVASTLVICNRGSASFYRIAVRPAGAAIANQHYIAYDVPIGTNVSSTFTIGMSLATTDVVSVYANSANLSFNLFGVENT